MSELPHIEDALTLHFSDGSTGTIRGLLDERALLRAIAEGAKGYQIRHSHRCTSIRFPQRGPATDAPCTCGAKDLADALAAYEAWRTR